MLIYSYNSAPAVAAVDSLAKSSGGSLTDNDSPVLIRLNANLGEMALHSASSISPPRPSMLPPSQQLLVLPATEDHNNMTDQPIHYASPSHDGNGAMASSGNNGDDHNSASFIDANGDCVGEMVLLAASPIVVDSSPIKDSVDCDDNSSTTAVKCPTNPSMASETAESAMLTSSNVPLVNHPEAEPMQDSPASTIVPHDDRELASSSAVTSDDMSPVTDVTTDEVDVPVPITDVNLNEEYCDAVLRMSFNKILDSKRERGGVKLHRSLMVLRVIRKVRQEILQAKIAEHTMPIIPNHHSTNQTPVSNEMGQPEDHVIRLELAGMTSSNTTEETHTTQDNCLDQGPINTTTASFDASTKTMQVKGEMQNDAKCVDTGYYLDYREPGMSLIDEDDDVFLDDDQLESEKSTKPSPWTPDIPGVPEIDQEPTDSGNNDKENRINDLSVHLPEAPVDSGKIHDLRVQDEIPNLAATISAVIQATAHLNTAPSESSSKKRQSSRKRKSSQTIRSSQESSSPGNGRNTVNYVVPAERNLNNIMTDNSSKTFVSDGGSANPPPLLSDMNGAQPIKRERRWNYSCSTAISAAAAVPMYNLIALLNSHFSHLLSNSAAFNSHGPSTTTATTTSIPPACTNDLINDVINSQSASTKPSPSLFTLTNAALPTCSSPDPQGSYGITIANHNASSSPPSSNFLCLHPCASTTTITTNSVNVYNAASAIIASSTLQPPHSCSIIPTPVSSSSPSYMIAPSASLTASHQYLTGATSSPNTFFAWPNLQLAVLH